jgi:hypothetical protein
MSYGIFKISKTDYRSEFPFVIKSIGSYSPILWISFGLLTTLYAIKTFTRSWDWKDNVSICKDVKIVDHSATAHYYWGNALLSQCMKMSGHKNRDTWTRRYEYQAAIGIIRIIRCYTYLGDALNKKGDADKAIPYIEQYNR